MLYADKVRLCSAILRPLAPTGLTRLPFRAQNDLQRQLKLNLLKIEERELVYFTENCYNIGTQAALLAGFSFSALMQASAIAGTMNKGIQVLRVGCG